MAAPCEAWVKKEVLASDPRLAPLLQQWADLEKTYSFADVKAKFDASMKKRQEAVAAAKKAGKPIPTFPPARAPRDDMAGQARPANLYCGCLHPIIGYGIKGAIWYQGESNSGRADQYSHLFPMMITHWRNEWQQGDFPFYWVQLADYRAETPQPGDSDWAELREAQTQTQNTIKNGGQAVIIDLGEGKDIHPTNKRDVAERLVRWALAKDYGKTISYRSPEFKAAAFTGSKATVTIDTFGSKLSVFDVKEVRGLAVCGADKKWHAAQGQIASDNTVEVTCKEVPQPVAVRYAWADNPVCNLYSAHGLPVTPFRSDSFERITKGKVTR
jgi:sialate O-acetylesterase